MKMTSLRLMILGFAFDDAPCGRMTNVMARSAVIAGRRSRSCAEGAVI